MFQVLGPNPSPSLGCEALEQAARGNKTAGTAEVFQRRLSNHLFSLAFLSLCFPGLVY